MPNNYNSISSIFSEYLPAIYDDILKKLEIWAKATPIPGWDPAIFRWDADGRVIRYQDYGDRNSEYGWEFDHITPKIFGGSDDISNLRPLHYKGNAGRGAVAAKVAKLFRDIQ